VFPASGMKDCPVTIAEAFASGRSVVTSRIGSMIELVEDAEPGCIQSK